MVEGLKPIESAAEFDALIAGDKLRRARRCPYGPLDGIASRPLGVWDIIPGDVVATIVVAAAAAASAGAAGVVARAAQAAREGRCDSVAEALAAEASRALGSPSSSACGGGSLGGGAGLAPRAAARRSLAAKLELSSAADGGAGADLDASTLNSPSDSSTRPDSPTGDGEQQEHNQQQQHNQPQQHNQQHQQQQQQLQQQQQQRQVIVIFSAEWCGPCKMIKPYLSTLATGGDWPLVIFAVADVDALETVAAAQGVTSMPTTMAFKGGKKLGEVIGTSRAAIAELLATHGTA